MEPPPCEWSECFSRSGKKFYYNSRTTISQWEVPPELIAYKKYQERLAELERSATTQNSATNNNNLHNHTHQPSHLSHSNSNHTMPQSYAHSTPQTHQTDTPNRYQTIADTRNNHTTPLNNSGGVHHAAVAVSRRPSLNNHINSRDENTSIHEDIPSPNLKIRSNYQSPLLVKNQTKTVETNKLSKILNSSLDGTDFSDTAQKQEILRTKFLDTASINLLTNQAAELLERQAKQISEDARRTLEVDLLRTITECANLRAVQKVQSLRSLNIEYKLQTLQEHIKWLEDGNDFT